MSPSLTPTYTPGITGEYSLQALAGSMLRLQNDIPLPALSLLSDGSASHTARCVFSPTYTIYTSLHCRHRYANRALRIAKHHLFHSQPSGCSYPPAMPSFPPTRMPKQAGFNTLLPTPVNSRRSLTHLQSFTGTYNLPPPATHALTPPFKGVSARGVGRGLWGRGQDND